MKQYLDLLKEVREFGAEKKQRAVLKSSNTRPNILSLFGRQIRFDLQNGFPLVTTKKMPWAAIAHELIWFLSGSTNIKYLKDNNVKIWDEWSDENGELGPVYGKQWRNWEGPQGKVDQISKLICDIIKVKENPYASEGRRLILSSWNPADMPDSKIPTGCHTFTQFNVTEGFLSCQMYQRSADMFLGVPFNIASYALLLSILAVRTGLKPGEFVHTFGDAHIYENHFEAVDTQLKRIPFRLPTLKIDEQAVQASVDLKDLKLEYFTVEGYHSYGRLPGEVAV